MDNVNRVDSNMVYCISAIQHISRGHVGLSIPHPNSNRILVKMEDAFLFIRCWERFTWEPFAYIVKQVIMSNSSKLVRTSLKSRF